MLPNCELSSTLLYLLMVLQIQKMTVTAFSMFYKTYYMHKRSTQKKSNNAQTKKKQYCAVNTTKNV